MTIDSLPALQGAVALPHLGTIRVAGADAASFLQGQLTQDFAHLSSQQARLTAYLNPQGRMLASMIGLALDAQTVLLLLPRDLLASTLKRLSMFVLRAKVQLTDASADYQLWGLAGDAASAVLPANLPPWSCRLAGVDGPNSQDGQARAVQLYPAHGQQRALWLAPSSAPPPAAPVLDSLLWHWSEVRSGVATLTAPVAGAFVPQMLNYESIGGVNFKKGCYPGQEVVARSQFRGTLKRRTYLAQADDLLACGAEVFAAGNNEQPVGLVVQAASAPGGGCAALVALQVAAADQALLVAGHALHLQALPYALLEDI